MTIMLQAHRIIIRMGLVVSSIFFALGFPCSTSPLPQAMFRTTCAGYFLGNLGASVAQSGIIQVFLRLAMVSNSLASLIVSKWWCMGFGEWVILQTLEAAFQVAGGIFLIESHVFWHPCTGRTMRSSRRTSGAACGSQSALRASCRSSPAWARRASSRCRPCAERC